MYIYTGIHRQMPTYGEGREQETDYCLRWSYGLLNIYLYVCVCVCVTSCVSLSSCDNIEENTQMNTADRRKSAPQLLIKCGIARGPSCYKRSFCFTLVPMCKEATLLYAYVRRKVEEERKGVCRNQGPYSGTLVGRTWFVLLAFWKLPTKNSPCLPS